MRKNLLYTGMFTLLFSMMFVSLKAQNIVYIYDANRIDPATTAYADQPFMDLLEAQGYTVTPFQIIDLSAATADDLATLNGADLVVIGRAVGSTNFEKGPKQEAWNAITAPILTSNMWALRNNRLCWFDTDACSNVAAASADEVFQGDIVIDDPVFYHLSGSVDWWTGNYSVIETSDAGNGDVLAVKSDGGQVLFARFEADVEFYSGGPTPAGERVFMGCENDDQDVFNYLAYTDAIKKVYVNEVARILGVFEGVNENAESLKSLSLYPVPANDKLTVNMANMTKVDVLDVTGKLISTHTVNTNTTSLDINSLSNGIYIIKATDKNNASSMKKFIKE